MVNKCVATNCSTSYKTGQKKASFHFLQDQELKRKWIYFVNRKDWLPNANRGGHPCLFSKIGEKCPNLRQEYPDCGHLRIKFLI